MVTEDQSEVVAFLASPSTHGGAVVERIDTHASIVFLAGLRALKLKRAVRYDYLDFSTAERRKTMCEGEVRINRRSAPALYRGVLPVARRSDGSLALGGSGKPVDWLVEMVRFDQDGLFDRLAARGALDLTLMRSLAAAIARLHASAERRSDHGGAAGMAWVVDGNAAGFADQGAGILDAAACSDLTRSSREQLERHRCLLDARRNAGYVRQCHGDLHLRNIVLLDRRPTLFDAIEFNDEIACTDVLYDLAFLLMDLWRRQLPRHANAVWNGYLAEALDLEGIALLPLFLSCRAAVRAKTSATAASLQADPLRKGELQEAARDYLAMAQRLLRPPPPCLIAIGGFSGSGKSTVAQALAPLVAAVPGAVVIRSDETRKQLCGVEPLQRLGPEGYATDVTRRVYATIAHRAAQVVAGGHAAIVDAVYARSGDRNAIERIAEAAHVPFVGVWLEAPESVLIARVGRRHLDASDADATVIRGQLTRDPGAINWHRVDASRALDDVRTAIASMLRERLNVEVVSRRTSD
ncbi:MAG TPA: AAA family ATPase [Vicinamibacterales bacterium]|nr:AAA family ATPase [Vicinamibacterales bacterium]